MSQFKIMSARTFEKYTCERGDCVCEKFKKKFVKYGISHKTYNLTENMCKDHMRQYKKIFKITLCPIKFNVMILYKKYQKM